MIALNAWHAAAEAVPTPVMLELMLSEKLREYGVVGAGGAD